MPSRTHDHEIKLSDGTTKGLDLLRDSSGKALYTVLEDIPKYQNPLETTQKDWSGGFGTLWFKGEPNYYEGQNVDTSLPGVIAPGGYVTSPVELNFLNKAWAYVTTPAYVDETTASRNATTGDMNLMRASPVEGDIYYFGFDSSVNAPTRLVLDISQQGAGTWTITWEYYTGSDWAALTTTTDEISNFRAATGERQLIWSNNISNAFDVNGTTAYWIRARLSSYTSKTTTPLATRAWAYANVGFESDPITTIHFGANSKQYTCTDDGVWEFDSTNSRWLQRLVASSTIADLVEFNGLLFVAHGNSTAWQYSSDGLSYTSTDLSEGNATKFLVAPNPAGTANVLWAVQTPNELFNTTDGRTAGTGGVAPSGPTYIGDTSSNITNIFTLGDKIMVGKTDGLYHLDSSGGVHLVLDFRNNRDTQNFKYVANWQGLVYTSLKTGVVELSPSGEVTNVGPLAKIDSIGKAGTIVGIAGDKDYLYIAIEEGTNQTYIYKGRILNGKWSWCPWVYYTSGAINHLSVTPSSSALRRALWFGETGNNTTLRCYLYDNILAPGEDAYYTTGLIRFSYDYGTNPIWDKLYQSIVLERWNFSANETVQVKYRKDAETSFTACTSAQTTNGTTRINLSSELACKRIQFELDLTFATGHSTTVPHVTFFQAKGVEVPETVRVHECVYAVGNSPTRRTSTIRTFLRNARTTTSLIKLADLRFGQSTSATDYVWVVMQPGYPQEVEVVQEKGNTPEQGLKVRWQEVSFTIS